MGHPIDHSLDEGGRHGNRRIVMQDIATLSPERRDPVVVAWMDQFGQQVTFVAARANDGQWYANGSRIGQPTHWDELPRIEAGAARSAAAVQPIR